jgi:hypothetical protein
MRAALKAEAVKTEAVKNVRRSSSIVALQLCAREPVSGCIQSMKKSVRRKSTN